MGLTTASAYNSLGWSQSYINPGFSPTYQGPDTYAYATNFTIASTGVNTIYAEEDTLAPLASVTIDLTNLTDFFNQPIVFTRVYTLQVGSADANLEIGPGASNGCVWFFGSASDKIVVKAGSDFMYNSTYPFTVDGSSKNIDLYNPSATTTLTYKIAIIGGQGAGTTTTTTTTATSTSTTTSTTTSATTTSTTTT